MKNRKDVRDKFSYNDGLLFRNNNLFEAVGTVRDKRGYLSVSSGGKNYYLHRLVWIYHNDTIDDGLQIDHIDHDKTNNDISNLRATESCENGRNLPKFKTNTSGTSGVYFDKTRSKWVAQIYNAGKRFQLGRFENKDDAIEARKEAELKFGYHKNHGKDK